MEAAAGLCSGGTLLQSASRAGCICHAGRIDRAAGVNLAAWKRRFLVSFESEESQNMQIEILFRRFSMIAFYSPKL